MGISEINKEDLEEMVLALTQENAILKFKMKQFSNGQINFGDYICEWAEKHKYKWQRITYEGYYRNIHTHIAPYFKENNITLQSIKPSDIEAYYSLKMSEGLSGNTIRRHHANIRKCLQSALKDELISSNPAVVADLPSQYQKPIDYYSKESVLRLLKLTRFTNLYPVILLALLGLRRSELLGVRWSKIDLKNSTLIISSKIVPLKTNSISIQDILKTKSSYRTLSIPEFIKPELISVYNQQSNNYAKNPEKYNRKYLDYVCVDSKGNIINPHRASDMLLHVVKKHKLPPITLKGLRHTCATLISNLGFNLKYVQAWLGHSTITITANTYTHISQSDKVVVSDALQDRIFSEIG